MAEELKAVSEIEEDMMLTTIDNPFNPKLEYEQWRMWDVDNEYKTEEYMARVMDVPYNVDLGNDWVINELANDAVNRILENDTLGIYKLV